MKKISKEEFDEMLANRQQGERLEFINYEFRGMDLSGYDLSNMVFDLCMFIDMKFENTNFAGSSITIVAHPHSGWLIFRTLRELNRVTTHNIKKAPCFCMTPFVCTY
ncbi:MAG TPA: hypothetical protein VJY54_11020 [Lachnospiraceae bacterium]|nr:hypothetical protein [Lachnospiraceae bacterium]